jgi:hypothetical protein
MSTRPKRTKKMKEEDKERKKAFKDKDPGIVYTGYSIAAHPRMLEALMLVRANEKA